MALINIYVVNGRWHFEKMQGEKIFTGNVQNRRSLKVFEGVKVDFNPFKCDLS